MRIAMLHNRVRVEERLLIRVEFGELPVVGEHDRPSLASVDDDVLRVGVGAVFEHLAGENVITVSDLR